MTCSPSSDRASRRGGFLAAVGAVVILLADLVTLTTIASSCAEPRAETVDTPAPATAPPPAPPPPPQMTARPPARSLAVDPTAVRALEVATDLQVRIDALDAAVVRCRAEAGQDAAPGPTASRR